MLSPFIQGDRTGEGHAVPPLGATIHATPQADRLHWFDASTGKRL